MRDFNATLATMSCFVVQTVLPNFMRIEPIVCKCTDGKCQNSFLSLQLNKETPLIRMVECYWPAQDVDVEVTDLTRVYRQHDLEFWAPGGVKTTHEDYGA